MKTRFIIDLTTGLVSRSIAGAEASCDWAATLIAGDTMDCEVVFTANGTDVTTATLAGAPIATLGVRAVPGVEPLLAMSTPIVLEGEIGACTLDLFTTEVMALANGLGDTKTSTKVWFEVVVGGLTVAQQRLTLRREVMAQGDEPPPTAEASRISASASAVEAAQSAVDAATARQAAQQAKSDAEAARDAAQTAAGASASSATTAGNSATAAGTSATNAANSAAAASSSATNAASSATAAASSATAAGNSATAAGTSATNASTSAVAAATSATNAANSATATATSETNASGSATAAAASASIAGSISSAVRNALDAARAPFYDGGNGYFQALHSAQPIGSEACGVSVMLDVPAANPAQLLGIFALSSSATTPISTGSVFAYIDTARTLRVRFYGATVATDYIEVACSLVAWAGSAILLQWERDIAGAVKIRVNGGTQTLTSANGGGTLPTWTDAITNTYLLGGRAATNVSFIGRIWNLAFWNTTLTDLESVTLYNDGGIPPVWAQTGDATNRHTTTGDCLSFGANDTNAVVIGNVNNAASWAAVADPRPGSLGSYALEIVCKGTPATTFTTVAWSRAFGAISLNKRYRGRMWVRTLAGGGSIKIDIRDQPSANSTVQTAYVAFTSTYARYEFPFSTLSLQSATMQNFTAQSIGFYYTGPTGGTIHIDDLEFEQLGCVAFYPCNEGSGYWTGDAFGNRLHGVLTALLTRNVPANTGSLRIKGKTDGTTNAQQLFGVPTLPANSQIKRIRARAQQTGSINLILGTSSGGAQIVASVALSNVWKDLNIALSGGINSSVAAIWATASAAIIVELDIDYDLLTP